MVEENEALLVALMGVSWKRETKASETRRNPVLVGELSEMENFSLAFFHRLVVIHSPPVATETLTLVR